MSGVWGWRIGLGAAAYLIGAIPCGYLAGRARGLDIRTVGSRNIGATNVFRCVGKRWGIVTLVLDALKGFIPALVFPRLLEPLGAAPQTAAAAALPGLIYMAFAIAGHNWPIYLKFKGGKGVATSAGGLLGVAPAGMGAGFAAWVLLFALTRTVSVASIGAALAVMGAAWPLYYSRFGVVLPAALTLLGLMVVWRHKANIARLRAGTENRISWKRGSGKSS